jgi:hypothetical protein
MLTYVRTWTARRRSFFVGACEQPSTMAVRRPNRATSRVAAGWLAVPPHRQAVSRRAGRPLATRCGQAVPRHAEQARARPWAMLAGPGWFGRAPAMASERHAERNEGEEEAMVRGMRGDHHGRMKMNDMGSTRLRRTAVLGERKTTWARWLLRAS